MAQEVKEKKHLVFSLRIPMPMVRDIDDMRHEMQKHTEKSLSRGDVIRAILLKYTEAEKSELQETGK